MSGIIAQNTLDSSGVIKAPAGGGAWTLISKTTASSSSTISITSGIDSTYKKYLITCTGIHVSGDDTSFQWNGSTDGGSNYNVSKTAALFKSRHNEGDSVASLVFMNGYGNSTGFVNCAEGCGSDNDQVQAGYIELYDPSNTTYIKNFLQSFAAHRHADTSVLIKGGGFYNTTSALNAIQFKMTSGNIDAGDFCLYGLTT